MNRISDQLKTVSAIHITPFEKGTGRIDWIGLDMNIDFLLRNGVKVIVTGGNTGEFYSQTIEEVKAVTKRVVERVAGRALVVAGTGYSIDMAVDLGKHAQMLGCQAVMIHQPIHPYVSEGGAIAYFEKIMTSLEIPSIIYFKDHKVNDNVLRKLTHMKQLVGVKYAVNDLPRFAELVLNVPSEHEVVWICGTAEKWAPFFYQAGATGFTSGLVNLMPEKSLGMLEALQQNRLDEVWRLWQELLPFEELRAKYNNGNNVVVIKEAMEMCGLRAGSTREPVDALSGQDREEVRSMLANWRMLNRFAGETEEKTK